ncbi:hypothetical protein VMCG_04564 [Cytospora schulzeri]|uniref:Ribosome biogenesis protein Alb1 n=1 Tax=Cytospora schulzeri TaxID=448051 RepID=A0A423WRU7_9PEZI|nr:hypothetical protein VMCG_04564 [Valsa malicola]
MAKPVTKKGAKAPSVHSRAARRATSPSINTDKSLKEVQPPSDVNHRPSVLGIHQSAGVSKKIKRGRKSVLSTKARKRHERGLERAEEIVDRTALKIQKSKRSASEIASRKKAWDAVNGDAAASKASVNMFAGLGGGNDDDDDDEDIEEVDNFDDEMGEVVEQGATKAKAAVPAPAPPPQEDDDEDIL